MTELKKLELFDQHGGLRDFKTLRDEIFRNAIDNCGGNVSEAADQIKVGRSSLYRLGYRSTRLQPPTHANIPNPNQPKGVNDDQS